MELENRAQVIALFPCFSSLSTAECVTLARLFVEEEVDAGQTIVAEDDLIDSVYIILSGRAEVFCNVRKYKRVKQVPVAVLNANEAIGLNETGFYSATGQRTATVVALTDMRLLRLQLQDLYEFLKQHKLEDTMFRASAQMLRMKFIKQALPFAQLSPARLQVLAAQIEEKKLQRGEILFSQGDVGDCCYLIRSGQIEILTVQDGQENILAVLKSPALFGEATLITHAPRNATARALEDAELYMLRHEHLSELIAAENEVANMFMTLMVDRSRPSRNPNVTEHERSTADGQVVTILKNPDNATYFKLSAEGLFVWQMLDGQKTLQDITLELSEKFAIFAPDMVAGLISKLAKENFIYNLTVEYDTGIVASFWKRTLQRIAKVLDFRLAFGDADKFLTRTYQYYVYYLFTKPAHIIFFAIIFGGAFLFAQQTHEVLNFFSKHHASFFLLLGLVPLSLLEVMLHELGHAYAVKAYGREVHYIGVGWSWFAPLAFTDTSDMWLAVRKPRMLVNLAGVYVDVILAGICATLAYFTNHHYIQGMLWLFALYTYLGAFRMLSPLQDLDGYYVLVDFLEKSRLRHAAVLWLIKKFPRALRSPKIFLQKEHRAEVLYWLSCVVFLFLVSIVTIMVQHFVFDVIGITANLYVALALPFLMVILSSLSVIGDIRKESSAL